MRTIRDDIDKIGDVLEPIVGFIILAALLIIVFGGLLAIPIAAIKYLFFS